ncbi:MAG: divalent-cation tolerance protein CutA [Bdellovibrionota bacterium]
MDKISMLYATFPSQQEAQETVRLLLDRKLIACGNILPQMQSFYWWKGKVESSNEVAVLMKTRASCFFAIESQLKKMHSYDVPVLIEIPIINALNEYQSWVLRETQATE